MDTLCDSYCQMANKLYSKGLKEEAFSILERMRERFRLGSFAQQQHLFWYYGVQCQESLHQRKLKKAEVCITLHVFEFYLLSFDKNVNFVFHLCY